MTLKEVEDLIAKVEYPNAQFGLISTDPYSFTLSARFGGFLNLAAWNHSRSITQSGADQIYLTTSILLEMATKERILYCLRQLCLVTVIHEVDEFFYFEGERIYDPHNDEKRQPKIVDINVPGF